MSVVRDITPAKFKCLASLQCPSIHEHENGDIILIGEYVPQGVLKNMEIGIGQGEGAIRLSREFVEAFFMEYAAKALANAK